MCMLQLYCNSPNVQLFQNIKKKKYCYEKTNLQPLEIETRLAVTKQYTRIDQTVSSKPLKVISTIVVHLYTKFCIQMYE